MMNDKKDIDWIIQNIIVKYVKTQNEIVRQSGCGLIFERAYLIDKPPLSKTPSLCTPVTQNYTQNLQYIIIGNIVYLSIACMTCRDF